MVSLSFLCKLLQIIKKNVVCYTITSYLGLTLILPFATIVALGGSASSKARHTYNIPHATIQSKCSYTGVNLLSYKHATFH